MKNNKGFTLIELLVVIVIIGILATLATVALSSARGKARDARRVSDVKQIQTALELYYNDAGGYPTNGGFPTSTDKLTAGSPLVYSGTTYMAKVPFNAAPYADPGCGDISTYAYNSTSATTYTITYCLGGKTGSIEKGTGTATPSGITLQ